MSTETSYTGINNMILSPSHLAKWHPVLRYMYKTKRSVVLWGLLVSVVFNSVRAVVAFLEGSFFSNEGTLGFINDPSVYTNFFFGWALFTYFVWLPKGYAGVFNGLVSNGVFRLGASQDLPVIVPGTGSHEKVEDYLTSASKSFRSFYLPLLAVVVLAIIFFVMGKQYTNMGDHSWYTAGIYSKLIAQVWAGALMSVLTLVVIVFCLVIYHLRRMFGGLSPCIRPAHIDGVGGLSPLGQFALSLVYLVSIVGVMLLAVTPYTRGLATNSIAQYQLSNELIFAGVIYFFASPTLYFLVLGTASKAMQQAKKEVLKIVCDRVDVEYAAGLSAAKDHSDDSLPRHVECLEAAQKLSTTTQEFPVWPFDGTSVRKFTSLYFAPLVTGLLVGLLLKLLKAA